MESNNEKLRRQTLTTMEKYIIIMLIPEVPDLIYYCGMQDGHPIMHEAAALVKQMTLKEAEETFKKFNPSKKDVIFCLIKWTKFVDIYGNIDFTKETLIKESVKIKKGEL
jgi:hypothetical protein